MSFCVVRHFHGHGHITGVVNVGVAVAIQVFDNRHFGLAADALNEAFATTRDDDVDILGHGNELAHRLAVGGLHQLHGVLRQTRLLQGLLNQQGQGLVGVDGFRATPQNAGVATFDRQAGRFNGDIGTAFENHAEHTQRDAHLPHADAAGLLFHAQNFTNDIGHGRQLFTAFSTGGQYLGREAQAVDHGRGQTCSLSPRQVFGVVNLECFCVFAQQSSQAFQSTVFGGSRCLGHGG